VIVPDVIVAKNEGGKEYLPHPEMQTALVCVDLIDLGKRLKEFPGAEPKVQPTCALVFQSGEKNPETGKLYEMQREFTISTHEKANLRKFLESWRGRPYTDAQIDEGLPLHKLVGQTALASIAHVKSQAGRVYANIASISPLPKQIPAPDLPEYERAAYWAERKVEYAKEVAAYMAKITRPEAKATAKGGGPGTEQDVPEPKEDFFDDNDESELPF